MLVSSIKESQMKDPFRSISFVSVLIAHKGHSYLSLFFSLGVLFSKYECFLYTVKISRKMYGKYLQLAASTCTKNFAGACRLFTVIIMHGRAVQVKVGYI